MNKFVSFLKGRDLYLGISRYALALYMIPFGVSKILRTQFILTNSTVWSKPLEDLSGITLTWAFLGYSPWFQVLLGFLELVPAMLLLFRRTTLLGAVLMLPMTLNVFLINQALNLWSETKVSSFALLLLNIIVLCFEWKNIKSIILVILNKERKLKLTIWEISANIVLVSVILSFLIPTLLEYKGQRNEFTGDWYNRHPSEWVLQSEKLSDSLLPKRVQKSYFFIHDQYSEANDSGANKHRMNYKIDKEKHNLQLHDLDDSTLKNYRYSFLGDSLMMLQTIVDSSKNIGLTQIFRKRIINESADGTTSKK